jgi:hypothetical protein
LFKAVLSGTLLLATLLIPFKASARQETDQIAYCVFGGVQIRLVDDHTIICRQTNISYPSLRIDDLTLYRFKTTVQLSSSMNLMVFRFGHRAITVGEYRDSYCSEWNSGCSRTTQFYLEGRRFREWIGREDQELLDAYSSDVTLLLDTLEASPRERRSF